MDILEAKNLVIESGHRLKETGLIARTWGNISCRVSDTHFVITPSGMSYDRLTPDDIVLMDMRDMSYEGDVKPSGEKGIHALVYKKRPEANFVIHTHQEHASAVSALRGGIVDVAPELQARFGVRVPLANYGLPGTKKLIKGVEKAIEKTDGQAVLMACHGALVWGADSQDAFTVAHELETVAKGAVRGQFKAVINPVLPETEGDFEDAVVNHFITDYRPVDNNAFFCCDSRRLEDKPAFVVHFPDGDKEFSVYSETRGEPHTAHLYREIYKNRPDIKVIRVVRDESVIAVSMIGKSLKPQLDDFAQLLGADVRCVVYNNKVPKSSAAVCARALKGRHALLLMGVGALCSGIDDSDAEAACMILLKACRTRIASMLFDTYKVIPAIEAHLMRFVYLKKYSKKQ
ncbi:MAG: class II aldolase/adducin family protein [Oscillospiraceae bacterium]|nr:class II aldolase/adducin family protein [Oscillospiraceae bacterium]